MGHFLSSLKKSALSGHRQISHSTVNHYKLSNSFEKKSETEAPSLSSSSSNTSSKSPTTQQTELDNVVGRKFVAANNKKLRKTKNNQQKMSVVLQPTVKQTASVIFLHGLGDTGYGFFSKISILNFIF